MPNSPPFISRGRERRNRSQSPHNRNASSRSYRRSRSRSVKRRKSGNYGRPGDQRRRSRSPERRYRSPGRRSRSPGRRNRSPGRKSPLPGRQSGMLGRKYQSPGRQSQSHSPAMRSDRFSSHSNENKLSAMSAGSRRSRRGSHSAENTAAPSHQAFASLNRRSPVQPSRQHVDSRFQLSTFDRPVASKRQHSISPDRGRWKSQKETPFPKREPTDSRNVVYEHQELDVSIPEHLTFDIHTDRKHSHDHSTVKHYDKAPESHFFQDAGRTTGAVVPRQTLHERFMIFDQKPLILDENITIGIQRNRNCIPSSTVNITKIFDAALFIMLHGREEGKKPIFDREEIKIFRHDERLLEEDEEEEEFERRIIRVEPVPKRSSSDHSRGYDRSAFERIHDDQTFSTRRSPHVIRKDIGRSAWPDKHLQITRQRSNSPHGRHQGPTVHIRLDTEPDKKFESGSGRGRHSYKIQEKIERIQNNPHDLRHNLIRGQFDPRMDARAKIEARRREDSGERDGSRDRKNWDDRGRGERDRLAERERHPSDQKSSSRSRNDSGRELPNFSRRTDKYAYEEWREKPELVPRGPSYFEHDNREDFLSRPPRGRGGYLRGRGRGRGRDSGLERSRDGGRGHYSSSYESRDFDRESYRGSSRGSFSTSYRSRGRGWMSRPFRGTRGSYRGRDYDSRQSDDRGLWKHDMFDKMEKNEDEKPSSTTKDT
ncbi:uncharacterized protein LOC121377073 [Gigantopelta aegis]|uniref:uncharacterized protein LOC121377073 n=1 Tax=Gigantopelta aegis TaxID=1735272 RepID=UPI001B8880F0|nr:uncharacterized protein LOC121377073 [Gigantopelta aegis]